MKRYIFSAFLATAFLLGACGSPEPRGNVVDENAKTIRIGGNLELSGAVAAYGEAENQGIKLAVEEINKAGGIDGKKVEYIPKDNKSENNEAASVTANLVTKNKVVAIIGPAASGATKAALPTSTRAKTPMVTPSATDDSITVRNDKVQEYVFRASFQDSFQGVVLAQYAKENLKAEKAVILGDNSSDYAIGLTKAFKKTYEGEIVAQENFSAGDKDFQAMLTKIKNKDFDVIYIPGYYTEAGLIIKQAREMGIKQPIMGADGFGDEKLVETAGKKNASNIFYTGHFSAKAPATKRVAPFIKAFEEKYGKQPSSFNALAYDAVYMIKQAIEEEGKATPEAITKGLSQLKDFEGVTGKMTIDKDHNPIKPAVVLGLTNGKESSAETVEPK